MASTWVNSNNENDLNVKGTLTISCDSTNYSPVTSMTFKYCPPESSYIPKQITYSGKTTIVFWQDGTKTVVKCAENEEFVPEIGVAEAIAEKVFGSRNQFLKAVKRGYRQPATENEKQQFLKEKAEAKTKKALSLIHQHEKELENQQKRLNSQLKNINSKMDQLKKRKESLGNSSVDDQNDGT